MEINDHVLKLTGKASLLAPLELGHDYTLEITGTIVTTTESNNDDGSKNRYYTFKPILCDIKGEHGMTTRVKSSVSQGIRNSLKGLTNSDTDHPYDPDLVYEEYGRWFHENKHQIYERITKRLEK